MASSISAKLESVSFLTGGGESSCFNPFVFSPFAFSSVVFSPFVFSPFVFSPFVFSPFIFSPLISWWVSFLSFYRRRTLHYITSVKCHQKNGETVWIPTSKQLIFLCWRYNSRTPNKRTIILPDIIFNIVIVSRLSSWIMIRTTAKRHEKTPSQEITDTPH